MFDDIDLPTHIGQPYENHIFKRNVKRPYSSSWKSSLYLMPYGARLMRMAACMNDTERVRKLLEDGVDPNEGDDHGRTALHLACSRGYSEVVKCLLNHNANCNKVDNLGNTPLHLAICTTSVATVDLLLKAGSSATSKGKIGVTPLQMAISRLSLLMRHGSLDYETLISKISDIADMVKLFAETSAEPHLTETKAQVIDDAKSLLDGLMKLHISKPEKMQRPTD